MTKLQIEIHKNYFEYIDGKKHIKIKAVPLGTTFAKEVYKNFYSNVFSFYFNSLSVETIKEHPWFVATPYQNGILFTYRNLVPDLLILNNLQTIAEKHLNTLITSVYVYKLPELSLDQITSPKNTAEIQNITMQLMTNCYPSSPSGFAILQEKDEKRLFSSLYPSHSALNPLANYILENDHGIKARYLIKTKNLEDQKSILKILSNHPIFSEIFTIEKAEQHIKLECLLIFSTYTHVLYFKDLLYEEFNRPISSIT